MEFYSNLILSVEGRRFGGKRRGEREKHGCQSIQRFPSVGRCSMTPS